MTTWKINADGSATEVNAGITLDFIQLASLMQTLQERSIEPKEKGWYASQAGDLLYKVNDGEWMRYELTPPSSSDGELEPIFNTVPWEGGSELSHSWDSVVLNLDIHALPLVRITQTNLTQLAQRDTAVEKECKNNKNLSWNITSLDYEKQDKYWQQGFMQVIVCVYKDCQQSPQAKRYWVYIADKIKEEKNLVVHDGSVAAINAIETDLSKIRYKNTISKTGYVNMLHSVFHNTDMAAVWDAMEQQLPDLYNN